MVTTGVTDAGFTGAGLTDAGLSVRRAAIEAAETPALMFADRTWTWGEAAGEASRAGAGVAARMAEASVPGAGEPIVAFDARPTPAVVFTILALIEAGLPFVPLDPRLPAGDRARRIARIPGCLDLGDIANPDDPDVPDDPGVDIPRPQEHPARRALAFLFSSGSTGEPRLIELSRGAFVASAAASAKRLGSEPGDRWLCCLPLAHVGGLSILIRCLLSRRTVVLTDGFDAVAVARTMRERGATLASFVPTMLTRLLDLEPERQPPSLRGILLGGGPVDEELWLRIEESDLPVRATYGMTETCSQVATADARAPRRLVPLDGVEVRERDGRLEVRGAILCTSIDGVAPPAGPDWSEDGFLRTGDLGRVRADGAIDVAGRADRLILTGGENVAPEAVEAVLEAFPGLERAVVFGLRDSEWGEIVVAALVAPANSPAAERPDLSKLAAWCAERLPTYARPRRVAWLKEIPSTAAGKPDVAATRRAAVPRLEALR